MTRTPLSDRPCPIARTSDVLGDRWALLVLRDAMEGVTTFAEFRRRSGVSATVLSDRLDRLVRLEVLKRKPVGAGSDRHTYALTKKGRGLFPVLIAMHQWGEHWMFDGTCPVQLSAKGKRLAPIDVSDEDGRRVTPDELTVLRDT